MPDGVSGKFSLSLSSPPWLPVLLLLPRADFTPRADLGLGFVNSSAVVHTN